MKLNQPALSAEGGCAGDETSFVWIDKQNVIIETVKEAEDGDGVIIRLYESENARTKAHISFEKPVASVAGSVSVAHGNTTFGTSPFIS